jgi:hypothetical protein
MENAKSMVKNLANVGRIGKVGKEARLVSVYASVNCHLHLLIEFCLFSMIVVILINHSICGAKKTKATKPKSNKIC